jgi:hypothetical protein
MHSGYHRDAERPICRLHRQSRSRRRGAADAGSIPLRREMVELLCPRGARVCHSGSGCTRISRRGFMRHSAPARVLSPAERQRRDAAGTHPKTPIESQTLGSQSIAAARSCRGACLPFCVLAHREHVERRPAHPAAFAIASCARTLGEARGPHILAGAAFAGQRRSGSGAKPHGLPFFRALGLTSACCGLDFPAFPQWYLNICMKRMLIA